MIETSAPSDAVTNLVAMALDRLESPTDQLRALALGPDPEAAVALLEARGVGEVQTCGESEPNAEAASARQGVPAWNQLDPEINGTFGLVYSGDPFASEPNPLGLLGRLWTVAELDGSLVLHGRVAADPRLSHHVAMTSRDDARGWLPGRLALRWMVETSGFRVESMFEHSPAVGREAVVSCALVARRVDRRPVLV